MSTYATFETFNQDSVEMIYLNIWSQNLKAPVAVIPGTRLIALGKTFSGAPNIDLIITNLGGNSLKDQ